MLDTLFIVEGTNGRIIIEKQYRPLSSNPKSSIEHFWNQLSRARDAAGQTSATSAVQAKTSEKATHLISPLITTPEHYLIHIYRNGLFFVTVFAHEVDPLTVTEFLHRMVDLFVDYFGGISEQIVKDNFAVIYELMEELIDNGVPYITEPAILKDMIPPPSILSTVINAVSIGTNFGTKAPTGALSQVPWRTTGVKYTNNEVLFDLTERLNVILDRNGSLITGNIAGEIVCSSKLSGMPDLTMTFVNSRMFEDSMTSFHPCVRYFRFVKERVISFIPPDGTFKLMDYCLSLNNSQALPLSVKPFIQLNKNGGKMSITLQPRMTAGKPLENVEVSMVLPQHISSAKVDASIGTIHFDQISKACVHLRWVVPKITTDGPAPHLSGSLYVETTKPKDAAASGTPSNSHPTTAVKAVSKIHAAPPSLVTMTVDFKVAMYAPSGIMIDQLSLYGEGYKPYKGVKVFTRAGKYEIRV
ncbi:AP-3 complex subunit mu-2 [Blyttiomyces sp. JEL0837]|nr:AP-3 complex subunit mu-2 [Blyttiomyces sp. JEL0837]